jgi:hypothetical protein
MLQVLMQTVSYSRGVAWTRSVLDTRHSDFRSDDNVIWEQHQYEPNQNKHVLT